MDPNTIVDLNNTPTQSEFTCFARRFHYKTLTTRKISWYFH